MCRNLERNHQKEIRRERLNEARKKETKVKEKDVEGRKGIKTDGPLLTGENGKEKE